MSDPGYPAALYELVHRGTPGDIEFYQQVCAGADSVLELGCGYGRMLEALAAPGRRRVGLDRHEGLLARARARCGDAVELVHGDMTDFGFSTPFSRVLIPYCGLYCVLDDEAMQRCLQCVWESLEPGGQLAMDAYVGEGFADLEPTEDDADEMVTEVTTVDDGEHLWKVLERSAYDDEAQRFDVTYLYLRDDGTTPVQGAIPQRFMFGPQIEAHVRVAGFELEHFGAGFELGSEYDEDADMWSLVARKPD